MKSFKNIIILLFTFLLILTGCFNKQEASNTPVDVKVASLKGPTSMGMAHFMKQDITSNNYEFEILSSVDEIAAKIMKKEVDIMALPANLAAVIYNNTEANVEVLSINTLGVLYICAMDDTIKSVKDLKGKTIFAAGKGATPEYVLRYILENNDLVIGEDVMVEWKSEHAECVSALSQNEGAIAMLPQPFVSVAQSKNEKLNIVLDLTKEWESIQGESALIMGVTIARKDFIAENPEVVKDFMQNYETSIKFANENIDEAAKIIGELDIVPEAIAKKALPLCNIVYITNDEMKTKLSGYLNTLYMQNPKAIGGKMPEDDFYYEAK